MPEKTNSNIRYITIQIFPEGAGKSWTIRLRRRFLTFLLYAALAVGVAAAFAALKTMEITGKVLTADHLAQVNKLLVEKQKKMALIERELSRIAEQERRIRDILGGFSGAQNEDSSAAPKTAETAPFGGGDMDEYVARMRALERQSQNGKASRADHTPDIWPVAGIVSRTFRENGDAESRHRGLDILAGSNTLVASAARGIVLEAGWDVDLGKCVKIDHDFGLQTVYGHLDRVFVKAGDRLEKGASLGTVGETGNSLGPHLHYEVLEGGKSVDPRLYLK